MPLLPAGLRSSLGIVLVPLTAGAALAQAVQQLDPIDVTTTKARPPVTKPAQAGQGTTPEPVAVTPNRSTESTAHTGSAVTVIDRAQIEAARAQNVEELLQTVPGVTVNQAGGVGGTTSVFIRGAQPDQTLVMIDGVRLNDPASTGADFDFSVLSLANVERIEIVRGPQSGLYGSDAIGGVINIITRRGQGAPQATVGIEGGSYRTFSQRAYAGGQVGNTSFSLGASNFRTSGFSRYARGTEPDATEKQSLNARLDVAVSNNLGVTLSFGHYMVDAELDSIGLRSSKDSRDHTRKELQAAAITTNLALLDGAWKNRVTLYTNTTRRSFYDDDLPAGSSGTTSFFTGQRIGAELQSDFVVRKVDRLSFGAKIDQDSGSAHDESNVAGVVPRYDIEEINRAVFAIYVLNPFENFSVTAAGRIDDFAAAGIEPTYRLTAAYLVPATGTRFHASYGTGAKAPTIQQRYEHSAFAIGNPDLRTERSVGYDAGVDQKLLGDRASASVTYFSNRIEDLIEVDSATLRFRNVDSARIDGIEVGAAFKPTHRVTLGTAYTHLHAIDERTGLRLQRRPEHATSVTATLEPIDRLKLMTRTTFVGDRFNRDGEREPLDSYVRVDLSGRYQVTPATEVFVRVDNLFNADYVEIKDFGTPGLSAYAGLQTRF